MTKIISPQLHELGPNFSVNRMLPRASKRSIGPFVFWDHMGPVTILSGEEVSVRPHPHIGLSTLTYLFSGEILHRDSLGIEQRIKAGEVNWMTAGRGIVHSERTLPLLDSLRGKAVHGIQIWVALPKEEEQIEPSFHHFPADKIPHWESQGIKFHLIAGSFLGKESPVPVHSPLFYLNVFLPKGSTLELPLQGEEAGVYLISGSLKCGDQSLAPKHLAVLEETGAVQALEDSHCMLFGGKPLPEPRHMWWNFVHSSKEKIEEAKVLWKEGKMGQVRGETEFIPLPND